MNIIGNIPDEVEEVLASNTDFSDVVFIKSYSSNITPNPMTKIYVSIEVESVNVKNLTSPKYLGSSNGSKHFGNFTDITVVLDIYSPKNIGCNGCYNTFFKICEVFSSYSPYIVNDAYCGKIEYDDDTFCFKSSCKLNISLFMSRQISCLNSFSDIHVIKD